MAWNDNLEDGSAAFNLASSKSKTIRAVAGPGSGKSFAIKRRIARLLEDGTKPEEILAITFTRTAAQDLKKEISSIGIKGAELVHSYTLHSHALKILMRAEVLAITGRSPRMVLEHEIIPALHDMDKAEFGGVREKRKLLGEYLAAWASLQSDNAGFTKDKVQDDFEEDLIKWLSDNGGLLVGEVIPVVIDFLRNNPASDAIDNYKVILVDEYQDLNKSEQEFIRLLRGTADAVIVGDDDQSIYSFKYAHPEGIQELDKVYGEYDDIAFDVCRRCPQQVTQMASTLISQNTNRTLGDLKPYAGNLSGIVQIVQWDNYDNEITGIAQIIKNEIASGQIEPEDILVLAPRRLVGYRLRDMLVGLDVPVKSYFREAVIKKDKVQRAYSLLNYVANREDLVSLRFLLGYGSTSCRKNQYKKLKEIATNNGSTVIEVLNKVIRGEIPITGLRDIIAEFQRIEADIAFAKAELINDPEKGFENLFIHSSDDRFDFYEINSLYKLAVSEVGTEEFEDEDFNFEEWLKKVFNILQVSIALPEIPDDIDHVRIMSLHSSKGLSAKFVILCSMIENLMPFVGKDIPQEEREHQIQEQRRLFYVAITRCKASDPYEGRLIISSFTSIHGIEALQMGIPANPKNHLGVLATRFIKEFKDTCPAPVKGSTLL